MAAVPVIGASAFLGASASASAKARATVRPDQEVYGLVNWEKDSAGLNMCMGTSGGENNVPAVLWHCVGHADQQWQFSGTPTVSYNGVTYAYLYNDNGSCLGTSGGDVAEGTHLVGWTCLGHPDQFWAPITSFKNCSPYTAIINYKAVKDDNNPYVVGVSGGDIYNGAPLVLWNFQRVCNNQMWNWILNNGPMEHGTAPALVKGRFPAGEGRIFTSRG